MDWTTDTEQQARVFAEAIRWVDTLDQAGISTTALLHWIRHSPGNLVVFCEALGQWEDIRAFSDSEVSPGIAHRLPGKRLST